MKSSAWVLLLAVLMLGVGAALGVISVHLQGIADAASGSIPAPRSGRFDRGGDHHSRHSGSAAGPSLSSVLALADQLRLDDDQRAKITAIVEETTEEVARHEQGLANLILSKRREIDALLSEGQRLRLDEVSRCRGDAYREERIQRDLAWLRDELDVESEALGRIEPILREEEEARGRFFESRRREGAWPGRSEMCRGMDEISTRTDARLAEILSAPQIERFRKRSPERRQGRR